MGRKWAGWSMALIGEVGQVVGQDQSWSMWRLMLVLGGAVVLVVGCLCSTVCKGGGEESLTCKEKSMRNSQEIHEKFMKNP